MKQAKVIDQEILNPLSLILTSGQLQELNVFNLLPVAIYICDGSGNITYCNKKAEELLGMSRNAGSHKLFYANGRPVANEETPELVCIKERRSKNDLEFIVERSDSTRISARFDVAPILDEQKNITGTITCFYDITEQKEEQRRIDKAKKERARELLKKNEELKKSEEKYHRMIEEVEDYAIVLLDKDGIIQNWNKGAEKIKRWKENEIVGKSFKEFYREEDRIDRLPDRLLNEAREKGKAIHEGWRQRKDGTIFWGSIVITALHDAENNVVGFSKVTRDLTERKEAENKDRDYTNQLEFQNKELEQFAYAASHDMKEPLRKISFYNNFVLEKGSNKLDDKSKEYLNRSIIAVKRLSNLIEALLAYSKTNSGIESFEDTDIGEILEEVSLLHKDVFDQKEVNIEASNLYVIKAIPFQIRQLLDNLISNSIKYKHPDRKAIISVTMSEVSGYEIKNKEINPGIRYHKLSVIDNGIGFEPQYSEKIFEIFQRLDNESVSKGSGIGLAICKKIVLNHHGIIKATGKLNEGARFDVYIPVR
jgi:PAS domain S-box-containing protein